MPKFKVRAVDLKGRKRSFNVNARDVKSVRDKAKNKYPIISTIFVKNRQFRFDLATIEAAINPVTIRDLAVFSRQFAATTSSGIAIVRSLEMMATQSSNPRLKLVLQQISADVQQGIALADALARHPSIFDPLYVSMVRAGETGGVLDEVLARLAKVLEDISRLRNQIKGAMAYPVAVGILAVLVFLGMTIFLIPVFANIFKGLGTELPGLTLFMLGLSGLLTSWMVIIPIVIFFGLGFGYRQYYKTSVGRLTIDRTIVKIPIIGDLNEKSATARFCRVFGTLMQSGVPILNSLDIVRDTAGNQVFANAIALARQKVSQGLMLSDAFIQEKVFPSLAVQMIRVGEETGELDSMLSKVADFYEDEVEQAVKALTSVLEPIMMVFLAGMVAVILLSMYLPMFKVFEKLG
jgi:type IV pilus assembly protein PilC